MKNVVINQGMSVQAANSEFSAVMKSPQPHERIGKPQSKKLTIDQLKRSSIELFDTVQSTRGVAMLVEEAQERACKPWFCRPIV